MLKKPKQKGYLAPLFVDGRRPAVRRGDAVPVTVNALHQSVMPGCSTGVQHGVLGRTQQVHEDSETA